MHRTTRLPAFAPIFAGALMLAVCLAVPTLAQAKTVTADVVIIDHVLVFNRLGAQNVNGMIYALKRDVVDATTLVPCGNACIPGNTILRPDKRPRPLVLRVSTGDTLVVNFTNLLTPVSNPFPPLPDEANPCLGCDPLNPLLALNNQITGRYAGFHPQGLELATSSSDDASFVGKNANSLATSAGGTAVYRFLAPHEGTFVVTSYGGTFGGEATGGNVGVGAFGAVNVEPVGARYYRSQVTEEELLLATTSTVSGYPVINYEATYPNVEPWISEGKANLPILNMLDAGNHIVHADLNAIVTGPTGGMFPASTYPLEAGGERNPTVPNRLEPFREFTSIFHDETAAANAFPAWFRRDINPVIAHTTHGVRDSFMINYGSGGIGSEIIANRLGVGPMHDCLDCAYEEFFLTASAVGDPAMLVDVPANTGLEGCGPAGGAACAATGIKAQVAFYPEDPSNVHHSYINDFVKFRNLHAGPKEQHVFHLHNHQWLFNANDENSNYLDAQGVGPGSGYTYEINFGGSGNRNKTAGDAIFHCHFYPHFAQGMWELWRVHDTLETGTELAVSGGAFHTVPFALKDGTPAAAARALPDGEILAGTPIPALVPLPGKAMAPLPGRVEIVQKDANGDGFFDSSQANVLDRNVNPGFPFWIAGVDCGGPGKVNPVTGQCDDGIVGQRPSNPPLDMLTVSDATALAASGNPLFQHPGLATSAGGFDGGLPRHALDGCLAAETGIPCRADPTVVEQFQTRFDFRKTVHRAKPVYFPEQGTDLEQAAMTFHRQLFHSTFTTAGAPASFRTNGNLPVAGAPFQEPCIDDEGDLFTQPGEFFGATAGSFFTASPPANANPVTPRVYKAANIQLDAVFNKVGYHFPQQRIISLWEDVAAFQSNAKPPEPFVIRMNTFDCTQYYHTNLVPAEYELDDFQVRTPTDIIGQHIHLPKWDLVSADGSANGWNYEDGTLSPGAVIERIEAINHFNTTPGKTPVPTLTKADGSGGGLTTLTPANHPFFNEPGARTTMQRWFSDPVVNTDLEDRGLGIIFTHDHFGPSTHQQVGLYATVLTEPAGSTWRHNETGVQLATRADGGPTSWQVVIEPTGATGPGQPADNQPFREFYFEFSDFQHAYEAGVAGVMPNATPDANMFRNAINPSFRQEAAPVFPDLVRYPPFCPGGVPRPCPEAISADDVGMLVVNYRNEPVGLRVFDPNAIGPDGKPGAQAAGKAGDLSYALQSRNRAISALNTAVGNTPYPPLNEDLAGNDPFTPMMRTQFGDMVRVKVQAGAHEHEHNSTIHGVKWLQAGSGHGMSPNSGWRNAQSAGISEQFTFSSPVYPDVSMLGNKLDLAYSIDASQDGWWSGVWGLVRAYNQGRNDLYELNNAFNVPVKVKNRQDFTGVCPNTAPLKTYDITAVLANDVLGNAVGATLVPADASATMHVGGPVNPAGGTLVYNPRGGVGQSSLAQFNGPLHDPTGVMYVHTADLVNGKLAAGVPVEPLVLRAAAGDCVEVTLRNDLPDPMPDLAGYNTLLQMVLRDRNDPQGVTTFNNNLIRASSDIGLHPQLVEFDPSRDNGILVGANASGQQLVQPNGQETYRWYMGSIEITPDVNGDAIATAVPIEFGGANLQPADVIKQGQKGLVGALVVEPQGSTWTQDANQRAAATVNTALGSLRDFATVFQKGQNLRYGDGTAIENIRGEGAAGIPEDSHDSGQKGINYGTEPAWFRFGLRANTPFGHLPGQLGAVPNPEELYSNQLAGGDPATPVFTATAGQRVRMHVLEPTGVGRASTFNLHGHVWQRDPYVAGTVPSQTIGLNPHGFWLGGQESVMPSGHFEIVLPSAGGTNEITGDYLFRDHASFGNTDGLWGILRVDPEVVVDPYPFPYPYPYPDPCIYEEPLQTADGEKMIIQPCAY